MALLYKSRFFQWGLLSRVQNIARLASTHAPPSVLQKFLANKMQPSQFPKDEVELAKALSDFIQDICNPSQQIQPISEDRASINTERLGVMNYWVSLDCPPNSREMPASLARQVAHDVAKFSTSRLVHLLDIIAAANVRHPQLLEPICEHLIKHPFVNDLRSLNQVVRALASLTHNEDEAAKRLIAKLKSDFMANIQFGDPYIQFHIFSQIVHAFARLHVSDQRFWRAVITWIVPRMDNNPKFNPHLYDLLHSLSTANVDPGVAKQAVQLIKATYNIQQASAPRIWLSFVHSMAILKGLDPSLAESVMNTQFLKALDRQQKKEQQKKEKSISLIFYDALRHYNIRSAARFEVEKFPADKLPSQTANATTPESLKILREIKFGQSSVLLEILSTFHLMLRLVVPLNSLSTGPEWHETGAMLEGRCFVDPERKQFVPLKDASQRECKEVAILFFWDSHLTRVYDPKRDVGEPRLLGIYQMNVRFLKATGLHPVIFTESQMKQFGNDERAMIEFIRHRIQHLSDHLHHNDWAEIAPNEMAVLGDDEDAYTREWTQRVLNIPKEREEAIEEREEAEKSEEKPAEETQQEIRN